MKATYEDITSRIIEPPKWWDENGTPRYCEPMPWNVSNVYAKEVAFIDILCQSCRREFLVAYSQEIEQVCEWGSLRLWREVPYGDPPNVGCCDIGHVQNSEPIRIRQLWIRDHSEPNGWLCAKDATRGENQR